MDPDPDRARLVGKDVDVVVAAPDRTELLACLHQQRLPMLRRYGPPRRIVEQRMSVGASSARFFRPIPKLSVSAISSAIVSRRATWAGGVAQVLHRPVGPDRRVAAGDVEPTPTTETDCRTPRPHRSA